MVSILEAVLGNRDIQYLSVAFALLAAVAVFGMFYGLTTPPKGKPTKNVGKLIQKNTSREISGIQASLDKANLNVPAHIFVRRSLMLGVPIGLGLWFLVGAIVLFAVGIFAGFLFTWTKLEQERDAESIRYSKQLATACDSIRTSYGVNPSLKRALESAAEYSLSPVKEDFQEILIASGQERFVEGLQEVSDRRRSIVFDGVATALIRANEATGEVGDMLHRLADSTRQNVAAFEEALSSQINARSNIQWGTYGPWMIFAAFRIMTVFLGMGSGGANMFGAANGFFASLIGNLVALAAAGVSIMTYRQCQKISQRGLVVRRLPSVDPTQTAAPTRGQGQNPSVESAQRNPLSAQRSPKGF